jgi:hypothetical protein
LFLWVFCPYDRTFYGWQKPAFTLLAQLSVTTLGLLAVFLVFFHKRSEERLLEINGQISYYVTTVSNDPDLRLKDDSTKPWKTELIDKTESRLPSGREAEWQPLISQLRFYDVSRKSIWEDLQKLLEVRSRRLQNFVEDREDVAIRKNLVYPIVGIVDVVLISLFAIIVQVLFQGVPFPHSDRWVSAFLVGGFGLFTISIAWFSFFFIEFARKALSLKGEYQRVYDSWKKKYEDRMRKNDEQFERTMRVVLARDH